MKPQHLYILAGILAALIVLSLVKREGGPVASIEEQARFASLMPETLARDAITVVAMSMGTAKEGEVPAVRLTRSGEGAWTISSAWNAPAKDDKIKAFLQSIWDMQGDLVTSNPSRHKQYLVDSENGIRLSLYAGATDKPSYELWIGKKRGLDETLVRVQGQEKVYAVGANLRSDMGVWDEDSPPGHKPWLKTEVVTVDKDRIRRLELKYPDHVLAFEKVEKLADDKAKEGKQDPADGKDKKDESPKPPEYEWRLMSRGPGGKFKQAGLDSLLGEVDGIEADDVLDPAKKKELGLEKPDYHLLLAHGEEGKEEKIELSAVRDKKESKAYVVFADAPERVYSMSTWRFDNIFKPGKELFDLSAPTVDKDNVLAFSITRDKQTFRFTRKDKDADWSLADGTGAFPFKKDAIKDAVEALSSWKASDYTDPEGMVQFGFSLPKAALEISLAGDETEDLALGLEHPGVDGSYVARNPKNPKAKVFVMDTGDVNKAFPALDKLLDFDKRLLDVAEKVVSSVKISPRQGTPYTLMIRRQEVAAKKEGEPPTVTTTYTVEEKDKVSGADEARVQAYLSDLLALKATALVPVDAVAESLPGGGDTVEIRTTIGKTLTLALGQDLPQGRAAKVSTRGPAVLVPSGKAEKLLPAAGDLKPAIAGPVDGGKPVSVSKVVKNPFGPVPDKGGPKEK